MALENKNPRFLAKGESFLDLLSPVLGFFLWRVLFALKSNVIDQFRKLTDKTYLSRNLLVLIDWVWFILVLAIVIYILLKTNVWDFLKAALIGIPIFFTIWSSAYSILYLLAYFSVFIISIIYIIYSKKKWYYYLSVISTAIMVFWIFLFG